ncbi:unnamed protein product [Discosporangium mesarthrocarpum]
MGHWTHALQFMHGVHVQCLRPRMDLKVDQALIQNAAHPALNPISRLQSLTWVVFAAGGGAYLAEVISPFNTPSPCLCCVWRTCNRACGVWLMQLSWAWAAADETPSQRACQVQSSSGGVRHGQARATGPTLCTGADMMSNCK